VLALCLGLAFLPAGVVAQPVPRPARVAAAAAFCCFVAGTVTSLQAFESATPAPAARSYIATARAAVASAPRGTLVVDGPTPGTVMDPGFFPGQADTAQVIGALARRRPAAGRLSWTSTLDGVYASLMTFDAKGRLRPVAVTGLSSRPPRPRVKGAPRCWNVTSAALGIPLDGTLYRWPWTARLAYSGPAGLLSIRFGPGGSQQVAIPGGTHVVYVALVGSGNLISVRFAASTAATASGAGIAAASRAPEPQPLCVSALTVGLVQPDQSGRAIPATPVSGMARLAG
jgi:hypothetical protein